VTGTFFRALAVTMSISLLTSLALALTWTPSLSQFLIKRRAGEQQVASDAHPEPDAESIRRLMEVEEASLSGFFLKVIRFHEHWLRRSLERPRWLAAMSLVLIVIAFLCYNYSGSDLLPAMDEGGFIIDYIMPAGSSLAETNRVVRHIEQMLRDTPEVESTSRRTGLQLGLAAVTEANTGDISVKLKRKRSRGARED
jgi:multidrug efflux pump subunit AcrB